MKSPVLELRVALTASDYENLVAFYTDGLGLEPAQLWTTDQDRAVIFEMGRSTLEIFDEPHAAAIDQIEAGRRLSGQIRLALQEPDVDAPVAPPIASGAFPVHQPCTTTWRPY